MHRSREDAKGTEQLGELAVGDGLALKVGRPGSLRVHTQRRDKGLGRQLRRLANVEHLLGIPQQFDGLIVVAGCAVTGERQSRLAGQIGPLAARAIRDAKQRLP